MTNVNDSNRYLDLANYLNTTQSFTDFEGMANGEGVLEMAKKVAHSLANNPNEEEVLFTLMSHYLYTRQDTAGDLPTEDEALETGAAIQIVISSRYFLKPTAK